MLNSNPYAVALWRCEGDDRRITVIRRGESRPCLSCWFDNMNPTQAAIVWEEIESVIPVGQIVRMSYEDGSHSDWKRVKHLVDYNLHFEVLG